MVTTTMGSRCCLEHPQGLLWPAAPHHAGHVGWDMLGATWLLWGHGGTPGEVDGMTGPMCVAHACQYDCYDVSRCHCYGCAADWLVVRAKQAGIVANDEECSTAGPLQARNAGTCTACILFIEKVWAFQAVVDRKGKQRMPMLVVCLSQGVRGAWRALYMSVG